MRRVTSTAVGVLLVAVSGLAAGQPGAPPLVQAARNQDVDAVRAFFDMPTV